MDSSTGASKAAAVPEVQPPTGRVRVVGWIRPFNVKEIARLASSSASADQAPALEQLCRWVSVHNPDGEPGNHAVVTLGDRHEEAASVSGVESYKLDWCYEQGADISEIFAREVKPLLERVLHGFDASILAYGARDSGKTQLIEGSDEKPGLAFFAVNELLAYGEKSGKEVKVSYYEVHHDHIYDLLKLNDQEVKVLEDAAGKVQLKGLSQVPIKTMQDLNKLYEICNQRMSIKKDTNHVPSRRHKGLIIYIPCIHDTSGASLARMNIVDLAGYEDTKLKKAGPCFVESSKINRSLYVLQNVVSAVNANDERVPYRDNKLTHMLKDFISRESQALMITCLKPIPCADTIQVASISSRSCLSANTSHLKSIRKKHGHRPITWHSPSPSSVQRPNRLPSSRDKAISMSMKKPRIPKVGTTPNKGCTLQSPPTARKLFNVRVPAINSVEEKPILNMETVRKSSGPEEKDNSTLSSTLTESSVLEKGNLEIAEDVSESSIQESCVSYDQSYLKNTDIASQANTLSIQKDFTMEPKHICPDAETESSPSISERLREITNSLRLLSCQPLSIATSREKDVLSTSHDETDYIEPRTPLRQLSVSANSMCDAGKTSTSKERFTTRSTTGFKNSLVEECLLFLNNASKEELRGLKGIGEKRVAYMLELREEDPEPFKELNDLQQIGLTPKQAKKLVRDVVAGFFN